MENVQTIKISWQELNDIYSQIFQKVLNKDIRCQVGSDDYLYFAVQFPEYNMSVEDLERLVQYIGKISREDREETFPFDTEFVHDIGLGMAVKLLEKYLDLKWEKFFANINEIYLIDCK